MTNHPVLPTPNTTRRPTSRVIRRLFRLFVSTRPALYGSYAKLENLQFRLTDTTEIVIDSYPRSANSFFEAAFTMAHKGQIEVAHHAHAAAQVLAGEKKGLPCVVLVREPEAAIASFYEMNGGHYPIWLCTQEYVAFYSALLPVLNNLVVLPTEFLELRFHDLMVFLRDQYALKLEPYEIDANVRADLFNMVDATGRARNGFAVERYSATLSAEAKAKRQANLEVIRKMICAPSNARRLSKANALYEGFKNRAF